MPSSVSPIPVGSLEWVSYRAHIVTNRPTVIWCFGSPSALYRLYLGIADGMSIARVGACRCSKRPPRRGAVILSTGVPLPAQRTCRRRCRYVVMAHLTNAGKGLPSAVLLDRPSAVGWARPMTAWRALPALFISYSNNPRRRGLCVHYVLFIRIVQGSEGFACRRQPCIQAHG